MPPWPSRVWAKNTTQSDPEFVAIGSINGPGAHLEHPYVNAPDTYDITVTAVSSQGLALPPEDGETDSLVMSGDGPEVPDVLTFDVTAECCDLLFTWTFNAAPYISHFEIRQGVDWSTGSHVCAVGPAERIKQIINPATLPLALSGTGLDFHIRAVSKLRKFSAAEVSDTLTAGELACLEGFCCVKLREIALTPGGDTIAITSLTPGAPGIPPVINVGPRNTGGGAGRTLGGAIDGSSFVPNGLLYDYTVQLDDFALTGEIIIVTEATRMV